MNYLLDTCLLSEFLKRKPDQNVLDWFNSQGDETLYISVLAIGEIHKGIAKLVASRRKSEFQNWLESVVFRFDSRILAFDISTSYVWGEMKADLEAKGRNIPVIDSLMAATALEYDLTVATRDESDFTPTGVSIINPWI